MPHVSNTKEIQDLVDELLDRDFTVAKNSTHWKLFSPDGRFICPIPGSASDWRAGKNWHGDVRRWLLANKYEPFERDKHLQRFKTAEPLKAPLMGDALRKVLTPPVKKEESQVEKRGLQQQDFELIKKLHQEGKTYVAISKILFAQGVQTSSGSPVATGNISAWMGKRGYLVRPLRGEAPAAPAPAASPVVSAPLVKSEEHPLLDEVMEIISSNLPDASKEKYLRLTAHEWVRKETK